MRPTSNHPIQPDSLAHAKNLVFLVGFMGAGKTSVGRALAQSLQWQFIDLDDVIEAREGRRIADIFRDSGEPEFRKLESAALDGLIKQFALGPAVVVALGGGTVCIEENAERIRQSGAKVFFLDASVAELQRRCRAQTVVRPLFHNENRFRHLYEQRRPDYMKLSQRVDTTGKTVDAMAAEIAGLLRKEQTALSGEPL